MQLSLKALLFATVMATVSAAPSPEPQLDPADAAISVFGPMADLSPNAAQAKCGGAPSHKVGSGCVGQGGKFGCSLDCTKIVTCGNGEWKISANCGRPTCQATGQDGGGTILVGCN